MISGISLSTYRTDQGDNRSNPNSFQSTYIKRSLDSVVRHEIFVGGSAGHRLWMVAKNVVGFFGGNAD